MSTSTPEGICNLALDKLGAEPIQSISAPVKPNEKLLARQYPHIRDAELRKHRWLFSLEVHTLTPSGSPVVNDNDGTLYRYTWPTNALRVVRESGTTWVVRGRELLDPSSTRVTAKFVMQVSPALFDELFTEAVACKLAEACCEKVTQSTDKKQDLKDDYKRAIDDARKVNAFELGPEIVSGDNFEGSWVSAAHAV